MDVDLRVSPVAHGPPQPLIQNATIVVKNKNKLPAIVINGGLSGMPLLSFSTFML